MWQNCSTIVLSIVYNFCLFFKHLFLTPSTSLLPVLQRLSKGCGRSTTHPSNRWSRPTSTTSWGSMRSQVSPKLQLHPHFVLTRGFFCLGCFVDWFVDLFVDTDHTHTINQCKIDIVFQFLEISSCYLSLGSHTQVLHEVWCAIFLSVWTPLEVGS